MLNIHTALPALWTWAVDEGNVRQNVLCQIPGPKPEQSAITPFSEKDVKTLLEATPKPGAGQGCRHHGEPRVGGYGAQSGPILTLPTTSTSTPSRPVRRPIV